MISSWRIIPVKKWLKTMVSKSPSDSLSKRLNGLQMGVTNHLLASMILQVGSYGFAGLCLSRCLVVHL